MTYLSDFDNRRRQYVPMYVHVAFGNFGSRLIEKWGIEGIGTWLLFLAACKREPVQGTLTYSSDDEAWTKLGARAAGFTLDEFWRLTGQLKKTSRRRSGRVSYVTCTVWDAWNTPRAAQQNPSKPPQNTARKQRDTKEIERDATPDTDTDTESESETTKTMMALVPLGEHAGMNLAPWRVVYDHWRQARGRSRASYDRPTPKRTKVINARLLHFSAEDLCLAIDGIACDPWLERAQHDDLLVVFRSDEQVEKFLELQLRPPGRGGQAARILEAANRMEAS